MDLPEETPIAKEQRTWAMFAHLSAFSGHFIPFGHIIGPLVIWILRRDDMPFAAEQAREALNFQITMTIYAAGCLALFFLFVPLFALPAIWLADVVLTIVAAVKASDGKPYQYPATLRLVN
jgi:uncharacterized Tic20 family protein